MCGIYGRIGARQDDLDRRATATLRHRGPDDAGLWQESNGPAGHSLVLGHTRLACIDLTRAAHQPMTSADGRLALVLNGEISNFAALRAELQALGRQLQSTGDTEVVLHLYELYGDALLGRLEGMYALALWDGRERRLLLARDPVGTKPLFWHQSERGLLSFASEIKALLEDPGCSRQPDVRALAGYLGHLYVPAPATAFAAVRQLLPGHKLVVDDHGQRVEPFHTFAVAPKHPFSGLGEAGDKLEQLLLSIIGELMTADVPVGALLSGGIDSGLVVALMARLRREWGGPQLQTFTLGFGKNTQHLDETAHAAATAAQVGATHQVVPADSDQALQRLGRVVERFDEPFGNPTALLLDILSESVRVEVKVALTGDGGDEGFGGYPRYRATQLVGAWQHLPPWLRDRWLPALALQLPVSPTGHPLARQLRRFLGAATGPFSATYRDWLGVYNRTELMGLLTPAALEHLSEAGNFPQDLGGTASAMAQLPTGTDALDAACFADVHGFLPNNVLAVSDRMAMGHGLELRVPLADRRIIDFGLRLPPHLKLSRTAFLSSAGKDGTKRVLREVANRYLRPAELRLPKRGFVAPLAQWLAGPMRDAVLAATDDDVLRRRGLVRPEVVARMREAHFAGRRDHTWQLWSLMMLEGWFQARVDGR